MTHRQTHPPLALALLCTSALLTACPDGSGDLPNGGDAGASHDTQEDGGALSDGGPRDSGVVGVDAGELPENVGSYHVSDFNWTDARDETFQPLTRRSFRVIRSDELAVFVPDVTADNAGFAIDDRFEGESDFATLAAPASPGHIYDVARGDIDEDGGDEALVVRINAGVATVNRFDHVDGAVVESALHDVPGTQTTYAKLATGDLDGDLRDEVVVATLDQSGALSVEVLDDLVAGGSLDAFTLDDTRTFAITTGDFNGDGHDELVVLRQRSGGGATSAHFYEWTDGGLAEVVVLDQEELPLNASGDGILRVQVTAGDLDGDLRDEVIFGVVQYIQGGGVTEVRVFAHDDREAGWAHLEELSMGLSTDIFHLDHRIGWHVATADTNGDQRAEVVSLIYDDDPSSGSQRRYYLTHFSFSNSALGDEQLIDDAYRYIVTQDNTVHSETGAWLTVLDDGREGKDTLAISVLDAQLSVDENTPSARTLELYRYTADYSGTSWSLAAHAPERFPITTLPEEQEDWLNPAILGLDLEADSLKLQYTNEKWLSLPEPLIVVAMAAPPVQLDISQNYTSSSTAYGHEVSSGTSQAEEIGTTVGATVSFESPSFADVFSVKASATIERELTTTQASTSLETYGTSFTGSALHDYVIFQGTLYTSYRYRVVAAADPALIGTHMTIDEPISTKLYKWTVDYFHEAIPNADLHIGPDLFLHQPGDVASYGDAARRDTLIATHGGWRSSTPTTVGQGQGSNRTSISLSDEVTDTASRTLTKSVSAGGAVAGVGFEGSAALSEGKEWSISVGEQVSYEGTVGDIQSAEDYQQRSYSFGLFVYNFVDDEQRRAFQVLDYWVEALGPGYE